MDTLSRLSSDSLSGGLSRRLIIPAAVLLIIGGVSISLLVSKQLREVFDESLRSQLQSIAGNVESEDGTVELDLAPGLMRNYDRSASPDYFQMWDSNGESIAESPSLSGTRLPVAKSNTQEPVFKTIQLPNGQPGRLVSVQFLPRVEAPDEESVQINNEQTSDNAEAAPPMPTPVVLAVATSNQPYLDQVSRIRTILGAIFLGLMMALLWVIRRSLRVGLEPLADIREKIMALDSNHLDQRISPKRSVIELQEIVDQTNALLGRMENTFARERQFSHDIAHELRTPLAELRNLAEVGSRWPGDEAMAKRFFDDAIASTSQMSLTLNSLLTLARAHGNQEAIEHETFDLVALIDEVHRRVCASANIEPTRITFYGPSQYPLRSARHHWLLIVQNLLNNAVSHGSHGAKIAVRLSRDDTAPDGDVLRFENKTSELEANDLSKLFDRLWRKETARSQQEHVGLGLSLVSAYAERLGLTVVASLNGGKGEGESKIFQIAVAGFHQTSQGAPTKRPAPVNDEASLNVRPGLA